MSETSYREHEDYQVRFNKIDELKSLGIEPYPHHYEATHHTLPLNLHYQGEEVGSSEAAENGETPEVSLSGRLVLFRAMGKNAFAQLQDGKGRIQVMFNKKDTKVVGYHPEGEAPSHIKIIEKKFDLGDIVGVKGHLFRTQKGELTVFVKEVTLLCKSLLPLPDKHSGLTDKETRYRKRWLDLIASEEVKDTFYKRSQILRFIRTFLEEQHFMEVETPTVQPNYGGAEARPFYTEVNALDHEKMYLRISLELALKKLLIGGFERIFEMGKIFRNEGIDKTHNPEFTMLEAYAVNWDYKDMMVLLETLCEKLALSLYGDTKLQFGEHQIDVKAPWKRLSMKESIKEYGHLDVDTMDDNALRTALKELDRLDPKKIGSSPRGILIQLLFEEKVEEHLIQPHHITDHPIETTPLCKPHRNASQKGIVERFESFIFGSEICNAYSELNDPILQRELLEKQHEKRESGDEEAHPMDEEFLEAIAQGMPPAAGIGIGIDRLVMLFTNSSSIRDVLFFPLMKRLS